MNINSDFVKGIEAQEEELEEFERFLTISFEEFRKEIEVDELEIYDLKPGFIFRSYRPHWLFLSYANVILVNYIPPNFEDIIFDSIDSLPLRSATGEEIEPIDISIGYIPDIRDMDIIEE